MDKEWVEQKLAERRQALKEHRDKISSFISNAELIAEDDKREFIAKLNAITAENYLSALDLDLKFYPLRINVDEKDESKFEEWQKQVEGLKVDSYCFMLHYLETEFYNRYIDREPMEFDGDIIITDPCYIVRAEHHGTKPLTDNDWAACGYGSNMEALGINTYMTRDTIYGDWSCTTFNSDTNEPIGEFCADAGLVSVFLLDEILKYNPDYDDHIKNKCAATWIRDFKGTVQFAVVHTEGIYESTTDWHPAGEKWEDFSVEVVGHGINKVTGEPINFVGKQTGF